MDLINQPETVPSDAPWPGCSFGQALRRFFGRYALFYGRASRSEFWLIILLLVVMDVALLIFLALPDRFLDIWTIAPVLHALQPVLGTARLLVGLATVVPLLTLTVRRLHDTNSSGAWLLVVFIPLLGTVLLLIVCAMPSSPEGARFDRRVYRPAEPQG